MKTAEEIRTEIAQMTRRIKANRQTGVIDLASARYALRWVLTKSLWSPSQFDKEMEKNKHEATAPNIRTHC